MAVGCEWRWKEMKTILHAVPVECFASSALFEIAQKAEY
jgi:hypothetical protein